MRAAILLLVALPVSGCFRYVAVAPERAGPGAQLRLELDDGGRERLRSLTGRDRASVEGTLVRREPGVFVLSSPLPVDLAGAGVLSRGLEERLRIATEDVAAVQVRELDRVRSGILALAVAAAAAAAVNRIFEDDPGGVVEPPTVPGPGEGFQVPAGLVRLRPGR